MKAAFLSLVLMLLGTVAQAQSLNLADRPTRATIADDPGFSAPLFDDSAWTHHQSLPPDIWTALEAPIGAHVVWQRLHFDGATLPDLSHPALHIGVLAGSVVYLNGVELGRISAYDAPFAGFWQAQLKALPQVYLIPDGLLRSAGDNVLAIRTVRNSLEITGVLARPMEITEADLAFANANPKTALFVFVGTVLVMLSALATPAILIVWAIAPKGSGLGWLALGHLVYLPFLVFGSSLVLYLGLDIPRYLYPYFTILVGSLVMAFILEFAARALQARITWPLRVLQVASALVAFAPDFSGGPWFPLRAETDFIWSITAILVLIVVSYWSVRALRQGLRAGLGFVIGATSSWLFLVASIANLELWFYSNLGLSATDFSTPVFLVAIAWGGIAQTLSANRDRLATAQKEVLRAQEDERRRIAHDLHDGVGQWLSTIKLNLQVLQGQQRGTHAEQGFSEVVTHVDEAIQDTRRIAHDLSPAMIEKKGLIGAIQSHADLITRRSGVQVTTSLDDLGDLPSDIQGHLFRIVQEALHNVSKHSGASTAQVSLSRASGHFDLSISDNGKGFDTDAADTGLGLRSMSQRAALIGAELELHTAPQGGTRVRVSGPLKPRR